VVSYIDARSEKYLAVKPEIKRDVFHSLFNYLGSGSLTGDMKTQCINQLDLVTIVNSNIKEFSENKFTKLSTEEFLLTFNLLEPMIVSDYGEFYDT